jgi:hypothetical protein
VGHQAEEFLNAASGTKVSESLLWTFFNGKKEKSVVSLRPGKRTGWVILNKFSYYLGSGVH